MSDPIIGANTQKQPAITAAGIVAKGANVTPGMPAFINTGGLNPDRSYGLYIGAGAISNQFTGLVQVGFKAGLTALRIWKAVIVRTLPLASAAIDFTPITFSGASAVLIGAGNSQYSDSFQFSIDAQHDYYIIFYINAGETNTGTAYGQTASVSGTQLMPGNNVAGDQTANPNMSTAFLVDTVSIWRACLGIQIVQ